MTNWLKLIARRSGLAAGTWEGGVRFGRRAIPVPSSPGAVKRCRRRECLSWGWRQREGRWSGHFRTKYASYAGEVRVGPGYYEARIDFPKGLPPQVRDSGHAACFHPEAGDRGWHKIHLGKNLPRTEEDVIKAVQSFLTGAFAHPGWDQH